MSLKTLILPLIMVLFTQCKSSDSSIFEASRYSPFGVCYTKVTPAQVKNYSLVVIEPALYTKQEIKALKSTGAEIIGYLTLGEVDENRWYFPELQTLGFVGTNKNWNSHFIDLENEQARRFILNEVLPQILRKGVDGIFLDTIDAVSPTTERGYLQPYMAWMIKEIKALYPDKIIIQNSGIFLLEETHEHVDAFLTEALASDYNFTQKKYEVRTPQDFQSRLDYVNHYSTAYNVPYFIVDFADNNSARNQLSQQLDTLGRPYFISTIELNTLPENPDSVANNLSKMVQHEL